jgi:hypothetical protein
MAAARVGAALLMLLTACRGPAPEPLAPQRVRAVGHMAVYGRGPVAMTSDGRYLVLELAQPADARFFNVHADGWVELLGVRSLRRGRTEVSLPLHALERAGGSPFGTPARQSCRTVERVAARGRRSSQVICRDVEGAPAHPSPRARYRDALLIVLSERAAPVRGRLYPSAFAFRLADASSPHQLVPELLFPGLPVSWAAYLIPPDTARSR